ncbi:cytochrome c oxidase subunit 6B2-like [Tamandua tetradactyla]|uniref:cytochrome c oxidase subunit 6B2-like n=1 Tax=Tamandua tetradactyla TaxID=48850 RepID=UPI004053F39C
MGVEFTEVKNKSSGFVPVQWTRSWAPHPNPGSPHSPVHDPRWPNLSQTQFCSPWNGYINTHSSELPVGKRDKMCKTQPSAWHKVLMHDCPWSQIVKRFPGCEQHRTDTMLPRVFSAWSNYRLLC